MSELSKKINILYLDDEIGNLNVFKALLRRDYMIHITSSPDEAKDILNTEKIHIIFSDQRMPGMTGVEFFESIIGEHPNPIRILTTGYSDINSVIEAINKGNIYKYIEKPWDRDYLNSVIIQAYEIYSLRESNEKLITKLQNFNDELIKVNEQLEFMLHQKKSFE